MSVQLTPEEIEEVLRRRQQDTQRPSFNKKLASLPNGVREQINLSPSIRVRLPSAKTALYIRANQSNVAMIKPSRSFYFFWRFK
ncbi:MAG: hypothetical protein MHMPM18_003562 [Marteilia pararefringens]